MRKTALLSAVALAVLATGALFVDRGLDTTHAQTADGAMALNVTSGATCDQPASCAVPLGGSFRLTVDVVDIPTTGPEPGYIAFQSYIAQDGLEYVPTDAVASEVVWPDSAMPLRSHDDERIVHAARTNVVPPYPTSAFEGTIVEVELRCGATPSDHQIELLPYGVATSLGTSLMDTDGDVTAAGILNSPLAVSCSASAPTATPSDETPTPEPSPPPQSGVMELGIESGATCSEEQGQWTCVVPANGTFDFTVTAPEVPTDGYIGFQTLLVTGGLTLHLSANEEDEIVWPDAGWYHRIVWPEGSHVAHEALTSIEKPFPISTFEGVLVRASLGCPPGAGEYELSLGGNTASHGFALASGVFVRPAPSDPVTIVCKGDVPIGDSDCSGYVSASDAALVLQKDVGMTDSVPCPFEADADADGDIDSIDAAVILMYDASIVRSLPP